MFNPPHPGEVIRTEIIEAHKLTVTAAAKVLGVSRQALSSPVERQDRPHRRHGAPDRKGFRPEDGNAHGDAVRL